MINHKEQFFFLLLALIALLGEIFLIKTVAPDMQFALINLKISVLPLFFMLLFILFFSLITGIFKNKLQGFLISIFINIYLLFRYFGFTKLLYQILLVLIFISIELFFLQKRKEKEQDFRLK